MALEESKGVREVCDKNVEDRENILLEYSFSIEDGEVDTGQTGWLVVIYLPLLCCCVWCAGEGRGDREMSFFEFYQNVLSSLFCPSTLSSRGKSLQTNWKEQRIVEREEKKKQKALKTSSATLVNTSQRSSTAVNTDRLTMDEVSVAIRQH